MNDEPLAPQAGAIVLPGVPGMAGLTVDNGVVPFPDTTTDFVKVLRERGVVVSFSVPRERRVYVGHKAFEVWLPILEFTRDLLIGVGGGLLVELLMAFLEPSVPAESAPQIEQTRQAGGGLASGPAILHVEWHVAAPDGKRESFIANGSVPDVLDALEKFEQHVRDDD